ncbi:unnamed protein product [Lepeophtheirus salmonis]|uniref:Small integral membrane protein 14 n=1 Tax=Lepeophtheirus salmonis TaxID=72036 RepID=D3PH01_LEPSM|nr:uncharacterized protein C34C12.4-like [Lepeophtheirus salmonis]ADD24547.1 protein C34C12.4 [Lepeophtheirus salmonis]CAB4064678.1 unnamed protein product [Lepeophtheirus salmonis]CAF2945353.1 unnamed protein product [Lepeophtheirus salmonis]
MGDEYDPCEYVFNTEMQMRRLLSWLRGSQTTCTEGECFDDPVLGDGSSSGSSGINYMMVALSILWVVVALAMYYMRPSRINQSKPSNNDNPPPPDPPAIS